MFTTRSLSSWVVLSSTTDLLILRHKIDYVTSLNVDFRREYHKNSVLPPYGRQQLGYICTITTKAGLQYNVKVNTNKAAIFNE